MRSRHITRSPGSTLAALPAFAANWPARSCAAGSHLSRQVAASNGFEALKFAEGRSSSASVPDTVVDRHGNEFRQRAKGIFGAGEFWIYDVWFNWRP